MRNLNSNEAINKSELGKESEKSRVVTFRCPSSLLKEFDGTQIGDRAERLRQLMAMSIKQPGAPAQLNGDAKRARRLRLLKLEDTLSSLLENTILPDNYNNRTNAYEEMFKFAIAHGSDHYLEKNLGKFLDALKGKEGISCFGGRTVETVIEYVEAVLARRKVEVELRISRQNQLKNQPSEQPP